MDGIKVTDPIMLSILVYTVLEKKKKNQYFKN